MRRDIKEAVQHVVDYNWADEKADFEDRVMDGESTDGHIFSYLQALRWWLAIEEEDN